MPSIRSVRDKLRWITPQTAGKVLGYERYWTLEFLELFLEECDEFIVEAPGDGYEMAVHAPHLARKVSGASSGWEARALGVLGSACRATSRLLEAEDAYRRAFELAEGDEVVRSELLVRVSMLHQAKDDPKALKSIEEAVAWYEDQESTRELAVALVVRGFIRSQHGGSGLPDYARALCYADQSTKRGKRAFFGALHNSALELARGAPYSAQEQAARYLNQAQKLLAKQRRSLLKMKLVWVQGLIASNLGIHRQAERLMLKARSGLLSLEAFQDFISISLDLALFYLEHGESDALESLRRDTETEILKRPSDPLLLDVLAGWKKRPTTAALDRAKKELDTLA